MHGNTKKRIWQMIAYVLLVGVMLLIFVNSAKTAPESSKGSSRVTIFILKLFAGQEKTAQMKEAAIETTETIIRKAAHVTEYMLLALAAAFWQLQVRQKHFNKEMLHRYFAWNIVFGTVYAATDEFHQLFVAGRSGQVTDVLIDACGVGIGTLLFYAVLRKIQARKNRV